MFPRQLPSEPKGEPETWGLEDLRAYLKAVSTVVTDALIAAWGALIGDISQLTYYLQRGGIVDSLETKEALLVRVRSIRATQ